MINCIFSKVKCFWGIVNLGCGEVLVGREDSGEKGKMNWINCWGRYRWDVEMWWKMEWGEVVDVWMKKGRRGSGKEERVGDEVSDFCR